MNHAWILPPLALFLISCASKPPVVKTEILRLTPPAELLAACPEPSLQGETYRAIVAHALDIKQALRRCNADKQALRDWAATP